MRTLIVASSKRRCKIIGRILKKAENRNHTIEFSIKNALKKIVEESIKLVIIDIELSDYKEKVEELRKLLNDLLFHENFPQIIILSKKMIPEEYIPIENCEYFSDELELAFHLKSLNKS